MGFLYNPSVIRRLVVYGASVLLLLVVLTLARSFGQSGPRSRESLLTFDGIEHAFLGGTEKSARIGIQHSRCATRTPMATAIRVILFVTSRLCTPRPATFRRTTMRDGPITWRAS